MRPSRAAIITGVSSQGIGEHTKPEIEEVTPGAERRCTSFDRRDTGNGTEAEASQSFPFSTSVPKLTSAFQSCPADCKDCAVKATSDSFVESENSSHTYNTTLTSTKPQTTKDNTYPKRFHNYLEKPTDLIIVTWTGDGTYRTRHIKKAKTLPKSEQDGTWVRRTVRDECTGETLVDEFAPLQLVNPTRRVGIFSDKTNNVLLLKNSEGKYELPSGPASREMFIKASEDKTGLKLAKDQFVPLFTLTTGAYEVYKQPVTISDETLKNRSAESKKGFPDFKWINPTAPSLEYWHLIEGRSMKFLDTVGDKIKEVVDQKAMCSCAECVFGEPGPILTPPVDDPIDRYRENTDEEWANFNQYPAYITTEHADKYHETSINFPNMSVDVGTNWIGLYAHGWEDQDVPCWEDIPLIGLSDEEVREQVLTREGLAKLHKQWFHLQEKELFRRVEAFVPDDKKKEIERLCRAVVWSCKSCRAHRKPGVRPKIGGLWAHGVGQIVACDTFEIKHPADDYSKNLKDGKKHYVLHMVDLFSGYSLCYLCPEDKVRPQDVVACTRKWGERFGKLPDIFYSDQGGEFTGHEFTSYLLSQGIRQMYSPPQAPYTNGVNERHNGILKTWIKRIQEDFPRGAAIPTFLCILREALRVKNATTRRHGYSATFLAFGYKPEDELQVSIQDMVETRWNADPGMAERIKVRAAAHRAVAELLSNEKLKTALTKHIQNTDKTPLKRGMLVDYHIEPENLKSKAYWEPNCKVLETDPDFTGDSSGKTVLICKPNGHPFRVARHKLRPSNQANCVQLKAIDLEKSDWEIAKVFLERNEPETAQTTLDKYKKVKQYKGTRNEQVQNKKPVPIQGQPIPAVPDKDNPNVEQSIVDFSQLVEANAKFVTAMTEFCAFGTGRRHPTKKEQQALRDFVDNAKKNNPFFHDKRQKKKKVLEESDEEHESTTETGGNPQTIAPKRALKPEPKPKVAPKRLPEVNQRRSNGSPGESRPRQEPPSEPRARSLSRSRSPSQQRLRTPAKPYQRKLNEVRDHLRKKVDDILRDGDGTVAKKKVLGTEHPETTQRRSSRLDATRPKSPLREIVDDRPSKLKTALQRSPARAVRYRAETVVRGLQKQAEKKAAEKVQQKEKGKFDQAKQDFEDNREKYEKANEKAIKFDTSPEKAGPDRGRSMQRDSVRTMAKSIERAYDRDWNAAEKPKLPAGGHRGPGDGGEIIGIRDYWKEGEAKEEARKELGIDEGEGSEASSQEEGEGKQEEANTAKEFDSDAETEVLEDWIPTGFYPQENKEGDIDWVYWHSHPTLEQTLYPTQSAKKFQESFPAMYAYFGNQAKVKLKPGREIPRTEALIDPEFWQAMIREIDQLIANGASFAKPPTDGSAFVYSSRWVYTYKEDGKRKARLVVRGFEEEWNPAAEDHATDSPTLHRDSTKLICLTAASRKWRLESWDITTAFQQAMTEDDPDETQSERDGLWIKVPRWFPGCYHTANGEKCLKIPAGKTLYGMASAPRRWYFTLRRAMYQNGFEVSKSDDCMFLLKDANGEVIGIAGWHVDDGLLTGTDEFWQAMKEVSKTLKFGKQEKGQFKFCGMRITQAKDFSVTLDQTDMIDLLTEIELGTQRRNPLDKATSSEVTEMRARIGSMLYLVGNTRPVESYGVSHLSGFINEAKVVHLQNINALVRQFKATRTQGLTYEGGCSVEYMYTFHDSSFKSERESGSQMGILTFVGPPVNERGDIRGASLLRWASKRARRVCHSTLAAETLAATAGLDSQAGLTFRIEELGFKPKSILLTDCRSVFDHIYAMTGKTAEMLLPDIHELREATMPWRHALSEEYYENYVELWWLSTNGQLADNLTKITTPSAEDFKRVLKDNIIKLGQEGVTKTENGKQTAGFLRPRKTQQNHSFGTMQYHYFDILTELHESFSSNVNLQENVENVSEVDPLPQLRTWYASLFEYLLAK